MTQKIPHHLKTAIATGGLCQQQSTERQCRQFLLARYMHTLFTKNELFDDMDYIALMIAPLDAPSELPSGSSGWDVCFIGREKGVDATKIICYATGRA